MCEEYISVYLFVCLSVCVYLEYGSFESDFAFPGDVLIRVLEVVDQQGDAAEALTIQPVHVLHTHTHTHNHTIRHTYVYNARTHTL